MKFSISALLLVSLPFHHAFTTTTTTPMTTPRTVAMTTMTTTTTTTTTGFRTKSTFLVASSSSDDENDETRMDRMQEILKEEASNPLSMKAAAEQMKNLSSQDMDRMMKEMDTMNPLQQQALKAMGMDPDVMKKTLKMMKENPQMVASAQKLMESMSPEELMEQSRLAQEKLKNISPQELEATSKIMGSIPQEQQLEQAANVLAQEKKKEQQSTTTTTTIVDTTATPTSAEIMATGPGTSSDPKVIDAMFVVAEFMSDHDENNNNGKGVTLAGLASLPVVQLLSGDRDEDLSAGELKECWASGSLGATRVDRAGFERVWKEIQEYFEDDIMGEARKEAKKRIVTKKKRSVPATTSTTTTTTRTTTGPTVGETLTSEQLKQVNEQVKNMSDDDLTNMLQAMENMDPVQEARMKRMGVDTKMMQKTAQMMKDNPMMRKAAKAMMSNMSPDQMLKMSKQAQEQLKTMSPEEMEKNLKEMEKMNQE